MRDPPSAGPPAGICSQPQRAQKTAPEKRGHRVRGPIKGLKVSRSYSAQAAQRQLKSVLHYPDEMPPPEILRARRVLSRIAVSDALAREIGALAFGSAETWRARL